MISGINTWYDDFDTTDHTITISSNDLKSNIKVTRSKDNNSRYYAKRAGSKLYDLMNMFEEDLSDDEIEEIEDLIMNINEL
jgi:hypothetical protein